MLGSANGITAKTAFRGPSIIGKPAYSRSLHSEAAKSSAADSTSATGAAATFINAIDNTGPDDTSPNDTSANDATNDRGGGLCRRGGRGTFTGCTGTEQRCHLLIGLHLFFGNMKFGQFVF